jgi:hypothetical protein
MKTKIDPNEKLRIDNYIKQAWHFDPELPSNDYQYVGRFTGNWTEQVQYLQFNQDSEFDYNRNKKTSVLETRTGRKQSSGVMIIKLIIIKNGMGCPNGVT